MTPLIFLSGTLAALFLVVLIMLIRQWVSFSMQNWSRDLTRDTISGLQETRLKLDSIGNSLERLERATTTLTSLIRDVHSYLLDRKTTS